MSTTWSRAASHNSVGGTLFVLLTASPAAVLSTQLADPYLYRVVGFTVWQASLSTLLSVLLAITTGGRCIGIDATGKELDKPTCSAKMEKQTEQQ